MSTILNEAKMSSLKDKIDAKTEEERKILEENIVEEAEAEEAEAKQRSKEQPKKRKK